MHLYTRLNDKWRYAAEKYTHEDDYHGSGMLQHDHDVGLVLDFLKKSGLDMNTIVWCACTPADSKFFNSSADPEA
jgi:arylsulfatase